MSTRTARTRRTAPLAGALAAAALPAAAPTPEGGTLLVADFGADTVTSWTRDAARSAPPPSAPPRTASPRAPDRWVSPCPEPPSK
ncbi:hypothetical protein ACGFX2_29375 [Streptomyces goshikiensis]|uniref:hypothetical protein n=1 Tax=Streptomyces goshikiensis TaxID=1942 RepID=UPI00371B756A